MRGIAALLFLVPALACAQEVDKLDGREALLASQAALGRVVGDAALLDRDGRTVRLAQLRGRPLLVSFVYTGCFQVCPLATRELDGAVAALNTRFGDEAFRVVSIGFNQPADSPQAMKAFALQHRISRPNWDFLSAPAPVVPRLASDFGFLYAPTAGGFDHVLQISVLDSRGRIVRQLYGDRPPARELADAMARLIVDEPLAAPGVIESLLERIRILCTVYDPETGTLRVDWRLAIELAGGITFILSLALYMLNEWWTRRRERRHAARARLA